MQVFRRTNLMPSCALAISDACVQVSRCSCNSILCDRRVQTLYCGLLSFFDSDINSYSTWHCTLWRRAMRLSLFLHPTLFLDDLTLLRCNTTLLQTVCFRCTSPLHYRLLLLGLSSTVSATPDVLLRFILCISTFSSSFNVVFMIQSLSPCSWRFFGFNPSPSSSFHYLLFTQSSVNSRTASPARVNCSTASLHWCNAFFPLSLRSSVASFKSVLGCFCSPNPSPWQMLDRWWYPATKTFSWEAWTYPCNASCLSFTVRRDANCCWGCVLHFGAWA